MSVIWRKLKSELSKGSGTTREQGRKYNKRKVGSEQEEIAVHFLQSKGYEIIEQNYFCRFGEIDIICKDGKYLVFVEVKYRANRKMGTPEEAISTYKMQHIIKAAQSYLYEKRYSMDDSVRFDVVVILGKDIRVIQDAFEI